MKKIVLLLICLVIFAVGAFANKTFSFKFDESGYISDNAEVLREIDRAKIAYWLKYLESRKHINIVLVTLDGLKGATASQIAHYALDYAGKSKKDDTLIFVVSPYENKFGIEMGENLNSEISYVTIRKIITEDIYPRFQSGDYSLALQNGMFSLASAIEPAIMFLKDIKPDTAAPITTTVEHRRSIKPKDTVLPITLVVLILMFIIPRMNRRKKVVYPRCGFGVKFGEVM